MRSFDADTQRSSDTFDAIELLPTPEAPLDPDSISRIRSGYIAMFGSVTGEDPLYGAVSAGRKHAVTAHWLPLFYENLETLLDYIGRAPVFLGPQTGGALKA